MSEPRPVTVRDLARILRLGKTTVAEALREDGEVGAATRARVLEKAAALGYQPNAVARIFLRQVRSGDTAYRGMIAYLASFASGATMENVHYSQRLFHQGASRRAQALGYGFETIHVREPGMSGRRIAGLLAARGVIGVIAGPLPGSWGRLSLDWSRFPAVAAGFSIKRPQLHRVAHHFAHGMELALRAVRRLRLVRIGLALPEELDVRLESSWSGAYLAWQRTLPPGQRLPLLLVPDLQWNTATLTEWLCRERPDAVLTSRLDAWPGPGDLPAGLKPPMIISLDRDPAVGGPGVDQRHGHAGGVAVDVLSQQIMHNERGLPSCPTTVLVEGVWRS